MLVSEAVSKDKRHQTPHFCTRPRREDEAQRGGRELTPGLTCPACSPGTCVCTRVCVGPCSLFTGVGSVSTARPRRPNAGTRPGPVQAPSSPHGCSPVCSCVLRAGRAPQHLWGQVSPPRGSRVSPAPPTSRLAALVTRQPGKDAVASSRLGGCGRASPECQGSG